MIPAKNATTDIKRVKQFLQRENVYKQLKIDISFLVHKKSDIKLTLNPSGGSFTDGKNITVGVPSMFYNCSYEELFTVLEFLTAHEAQHINSSDFKAYVGFQETMRDYFLKTYRKFNPAQLKQYVQKAIVSFGNGVEDGRIEKILGSNLPGYVRKIKYFNGSVWDVQPVQGQSEMGDFFQSIVTYAVTGLLPKDFSTVYSGSDLETAMNTLKPMTIWGINNRSARECLDTCVEMMHEVEPYLIHLFENQSDADAQAMENISNEPEYTTSEEKDYNPGNSVSTHFKPEPKKENEDEDTDDSEKDENEAKGKQKKKADENKEEDSQSGDLDSTDTEDEESENKGNASTEEEEETEESDTSTGTGSENDEESTEEEETEESDTSTGTGSENDEESTEEEEDEESDTSTGTGSENDEESTEDEEDEESDTSTGTGSENDEESTEDEEDEESDTSTGTDSEDEESTEDESKGEEDSESSSDDDSNDDSSSDTDAQPDSENEDGDADEESDTDYPQGMPQDEVNDSEADENLIRESMKEITDEVIEQAKEKIMNSETKKSSSKGEASEEISPEELQEIENQYQGQYVKKFKEIKDFPQRYSMPADIKREGTKFRKEVEKIFKNKESLTMRGQKRGILDTGNLWKVGVKDTNVFVKRGKPITTDYVAFILQDGSGSMREAEKEYMSAKACSVLEEGLKGIIPHKISTFSVDYHSQTVVHFTAKGFNDTDRNKNYSYNFHRSRHADNGNKDGFSIRVATAELMKRPEKDRILIVLSDGLPSDYNGGQREGMVDVKQAVKEARAQGIHVVSMLFGTEQFRQRNIEVYKYMYERNILSCEPEAITNQLVKMLKKIIVK